ncbi:MULTISPECIES: type I restriction-modification system subunit M [Flavobacterium]|uniref:type I restriction-modification system subunit M n=1 Tax=Flavobacterium TaxID=237 RepID=UPI0011820BDF|nr:MULTISPECIES: class I SAM-dependent DNA methyltransferase [Flavobacterium]MCR4029820.1 type I restriction-modification system subunit M [Flavobacterium panacis]
MSNVSGIIKSIQDIMRKDVGVDGDAQRISQLVWLFFLKIVDDREDELELTEDDYKSPLPEKLRWRNWAKNPEGETGDILLDFVNIQLFPTLKTKLKIDGEDGRRAFVIKNVFEDAYNYMKSGTLLRQVINKICEINFNASSDRHTFGGIYEQILKDLQSAGNSGEFYTPRAVTTFIVDRIAPKLEESVLDPACGTGGFLTNVIEYKRENFVKAPEDEEVLIKSIHGVEKKSLPHMLCTTNMILHGIDIPINIKHDNTLARPLRDYKSSDKVDVIVTNPPFGGMEEDGIENNFPANFKTRETANLFMTLIIHLLKNEGRAAVVLPDGFLFGEGIQTKIKEKLMTECNLHTIVRLPNGVFNPYTGIKTNILFFTKGRSTEHIWFYEHPYPEGVVNYNKTKPMRFEEFQTEIDWWGNEEDGFKTRVQNQQAWKISANEIIERNYNLDIKNPHIDEQITHDPNELISLYNKEQVEISSLRNQLKVILAEALNNSDI